MLAGEKGYLKSGLAFYIPQEQVAESILLKYIKVIVKFYSPIINIPISI